MGTEHREETNAEIIAVINVIDQTGGAQQCVDPGVNTSRYLQKLRAIMFIRPHVLMATTTSCTASFVLVLNINSNNAPTKMIAGLAKQAGFLKIKS